MREVIWTDEDGYRHRSLVRNEDTDDEAPYGIRKDPPDVGRIDWAGVRRDLHNALVDGGICSWRDVQKLGGLRGAILSALKRRLVALYREVET